MIMIKKIYLNYCWKKKKNNQMEIVELKKQNNILLKKINNLQSENKISGKININKS